MKKIMCILGIVLLSLFNMVPVIASESTETIMQVQEALNAAGYDCGTPDGIVGNATAEAIKQYQQDNGIDINGKITDGLLNLLFSDGVESKADSDKGVPLTTFVARYNEGIDYYNAIAERDGYTKATYISEEMAQVENFCPDNQLKFSVNPNTDHKDPVGIINAYMENALLIDEYVATGEIMALIYAFDTSYTNAGDALNIWKELNEMYTVKQNGITYDNYSFDDLILIKGQYDGFDVDDLNNTDNITEENVNLTNDKVETEVMTEIETEATSEEEIESETAETESETEVSEEETTETGSETATEVEDKAVVAVTETENESVAASETEIESETASETETEAASEVEITETGSEETIEAETTAATADAETEAIAKGSGDVATSISYGEIISIKRDDEYYRDEYNISIDDVHILSEEQIAEIGITDTDKTVVSILCSLDNIYYYGYVDGARVNLNIAENGDLQVIDEDGYSIDHYDPFSLHLSDKKDGDYLYHIKIPPKSKKRMALLFGIPKECENITILVGKEYEMSVNIPEKRKNSEL